MGVESFAGTELPEDEVKLVVSGIGVVFAVLVRDGEMFVERNMRLLESIGRRFSSFRVVYRAAAARARAACTFMVACPCPS